MWMHMAMASRADSLKLRIALEYRRVRGALSNEMRTVSGYSSGFQM
jgi:hypothetical protein